MGVISSLLYWSYSYANKCRQSNSQWKCVKTVHARSYIRDLPDSSTRVRKIHIGESSELCLLIRTKISSAWTRYQAIFFLFMTFIYLDDTWNLSHETLVSRYKALILGPSLTQTMHFRERLPCTDKRWIGSIITGRKSCILIMKDIPEIIRPPHLLGLLEDTIFVSIIGLPTSITWFPAVRICTRKMYPWSSHISCTKDTPRTVVTFLTAYKYRWVFVFNWEEPWRYYGCQMQFIRAGICVVYCWRQHHYTNKYICY